MDNNEAAYKEALLQEQRLIKKVFSSEEGQQLLAHLANQYIWSKQLTNNVNELYSRIGCQELITHFINCTNHEEKAND